MPSIAIDGPAGAGKSTVARMLAKKLEYLYIDTGAMYRALTLKILRSGISINDENAVSKIAEETSIILKQGEPQEVYMDGENVTELIRTPAVSKYVSHVSSIKSVREKLVACQRKIAQQHSVVMDGRDIGSCVLQNAEFKFFLDASLNERVERRYQEMILKGFSIDKVKVRSELEKRDHLDSSRKISPLIKADDALTINTTNLTPEEVTDIILRIVKGG